MWGCTHPSKPQIVSIKTGDIANVAPHFPNKEATMKSYKAVLVGTALVLSLGYQAVNGQASKQAAPAANATIERGRYVVEIGGCNDCHTSGYATNDGKAPEENRLKGDVLGFRGGWGTTYPTN